MILPPKSEVSLPILLSLSTSFLPVSCPYLAAVPDLNISQNHGTSADKYPAPELRVPVTAALPRPAESHPVEKGAVVADDRSLAEHYPGGVVDHHALAHNAPGVYVHPEYFGHPTLDGESQCFPLFLPQDVRDAASL